MVWYGMVSLLSRYENASIALQVGVMLRECIKQEPIAKLMINREVSAATCTRWGVAQYG